MEFDSEIRLETLKSFKLVLVIWHQMCHSSLKIIVYPAECITHNSMYEWNKFDNLPVKSVIALDLSIT